MYLGSVIIVPVTRPRQATFRRPPSSDGVIAFDQPISPDRRHFRCCLAVPGCRWPEKHLVFVRRTSIAQVARVTPSGAKRMCSIDAGRSSIVKTASGNPSLQSFKVESRAPDPIVSPWGAIARAFTSPVWPIRLNRAPRVWKFQILITLSIPLVARLRPSPKNAIAAIRPLCPGSFGWRILSIVRSQSDGP